MNSPKLKKKRGCNFTRKEKEALLRLVHKHKSVLQDKGLTSDVNVKKRAVWEQLTNEFNVQCATSETRTWHQLRHLYENLKQRMKQDICNFVDDSDEYATDYASAGDKSDKSVRSHYSDASTQSDNDDASPKDNLGMYGKKSSDKKKKKKKADSSMDHSEECEAFANYVAISLRKMPRKHFISAKSLIQQTLTCIELSIMDEEEIERCR